MNMSNTNSRAQHDVCKICGEKAVCYLISPEGEFVGPFCEDCSIESVFEYTGWRSERLNNL